jgi:hypothetical protein
MTVMPPHPSTLAIAKESLAMSEKTGDKTFMRIAIGLMALTGLGTILHAVHEIYRDLVPKRETARPTFAKASAGRPEYDEEQHRRDDGPDRSWVRKARVNERPAEGEKVWAEHRGHQDEARQR